MPDIIHKLTEIFREFPGIGPRQAKRFTYFLLTRSDSYLRDLARLIETVKSEVLVCKDCGRFSIKRESVGILCKLCESDSRDDSELLVVARDIDHESIERSGVFKGRYFVLGGTVPILEKEPAKLIRLEALRERVIRGQEHGLSEVILGLNATPDGEHTGDIVREWLSPLGAKISVLGRGLSTGTELEYSDSDTIRSALKNRF
jgi:recombination protein RecR